MSKRQLVDDLIRLGLNEWAVMRALHAMTLRKELDIRNEGRRIVRVAV